MEFLLDSLAFTLYHLIHCSRVHSAPFIRASVSFSDEAHLLGVVIRAIGTTPDSLDPPDHKPADEGNGWDCASSPAGAASACLETWDEGDGVTIDSLRLKCSSLPFTEDK